MRKLTENQKDFILQNFFKMDSFAGWENIANNLLDNGSCVVAGDSCIWSSGIGNFIKISNADNLVGCLLYEFDLENFLSSSWFNQIIKPYISNLLEEKTKIVKQYQDIYNLI